MISSSKHRGSTLTDLQKTALHNFRNKPEFDLREDVTFSTKEVVSAYFGFFDELFFFGSLKGCCGVSIDEEDTMQIGHVTRGAEK